MDSELHDAAWEVEADDHLESTSLSEGECYDLTSIVDATGGFEERQ